MTTTLNLYQRLNAIREKVAYIRKDKKVENYNAVTNDAVVAETRQWFTELGVLVVPCEVQGVMIDTGSKSAKGNPLYRYEATFDVRFINCDQPDETLTCRVTAHANDYGDKAPGKAITYATKSAVLKVLYLETGDNEEARVVANVVPGEVVEDEELHALLKPIHESADEKALLVAYAAGIARAAKDKPAKAAIIEAKNARQIVLKNQSKVGGAK